MAHYLKWPTTSTAGLQVSGIFNGGGGAWITITIEFAEDVTYSATKWSYLVDGRRITNSTTVGSGGYLATNAAGSIESNSVGVVTLNGVASNTSAWRTAKAGDVYSFLVFVGAATNNSLMLGARCSETDALSGLAIKKLTVTDVNGTHLIDVNSSGGTATSFASDTGNLTAKLVNFPTDNSQWIYYNSVIATADISTLNRAINQPVSINLDNYFSGATSYGIQSGSLPTGLSIVGNQIVGTCTSAQTTTLVIRASNADDFLDSVTITFKTALWLLRFDGATTNHVNIPPVLAGASTFEVEFDVVQRTLSTAFKSVFNSNGGNPFAFYFWNNSSSELSVTIGGSRKTIAVGGFVAGQRYVIKATYDGATLRYFVDGVQRGSIAATGAATSGITQLARNVSPSADMDFYRLKITENEILVRDYSLYSADGLILVDTVNNQNGTLVNFPTDNSQWVSYDGGGAINAEVDLIKSNVSLIAKTVVASADANVNTTKSVIQLVAKQLNADTATSAFADLVKSTIQLNSKAVTVEASANVNLTKSVVALSAKSLNVESSANADLIKSIIQINAKTIVGTADGSVAFSKSVVSIVAKQLVADTTTTINAEADLIKSSVSIVGKQLTVSADANIDLQKSLVNVIGKQLGLTNDAIVALSKSTVQLVGKVLVADSSVAVDAVVDLIKGTVTLVSKNLSASADAGADLSKSTVALTPKQLSVAADAQIGLSKGVVQMTAKFLSVGDVAYSVPTDRIFFIPVNSAIFNIPVNQYVFTLTEDN